MKNSKDVEVRANNKKESNVLFQKLGSTWYIFTEINGEAIYSVMPQGMDPRDTKLELYEVINEHMENCANDFSKKRKNPEKAA